jgi:hypothetical protein
MHNQLKLVEKYLTLNPGKNRAYIDIGNSRVERFNKIAALYKNVYVHDPLDYTPDEKLSEMKNIHIDQYVFSDSVCCGNMKTDGANVHFQKCDDGELSTHVLDFENIHMVDFLRVDTSGDEILVLKGARELLLRCKPLVQVTLTDYAWVTDRTSPVEFLSSLGYRVLDYVGFTVTMWVPDIVENIQKNNIYCFWTGTNAMTPNRLGCMYNLRNNTESNIILVTVDNLSTFIKPEDPLHEAYQYLSETHKCDYLRIYFMHHYGGGYTDIKSPRRSWAEAFQQMRDDPTKIINGYHEKGEYAIAYRPVADKWQILCGNGCYILRPKTLLTYRWYTAMLAKMDEKLEELRAHPATRYEDAKEWGGGYPLEWNEMLGRIFHRVLADFEGFILYTTPKVYSGWYR